MIKFFLKLIYFIGRFIGKYKNFIADYPSDNPPVFRYPQLSSLAGYFQYNTEIDCFLLRNLEEVRHVANVILSNEITLYELINKKAKKLHLYDFLGYRTTDYEKLKALLSITLSYFKNKFLLFLGRNSFNVSLGVRNIATRDFDIKEDFSALRKFQNNFSKTNAIFIEIKNLNRIFQIGSTLKGTNLVFTDSYSSTFFQELYHCNYHFEEGIRGFNNDNQYIIETWANVPWLYLMQCIFGRTERRIRKSQSPHDIKFIDYVYWRAYIGQGYILQHPVAQPLIFHGVYALIAPTANLLFYSLDGDTEAKNELIINAIFKGPAPQIKQCVNKLLGRDYFEEIFHNFNLFERLKSINRIIKESNPNQEEIYRILFNKTELVPTLLDYKLVALIWMSQKINANKNLVIDLIEDFYNQLLNNKETLEKITVEKWINYLSTRNRNFAKLVSDEYRQHATIIESL